MQRVIIGVVIIAGIWLYTGGLDQITGAQTGDETIDFANDDPEMIAAMDAAQFSLPQFLAQVSGPNGAALGQAGVKVAFDVGEDTSEIIWVGPFEGSGAQMSGLLANQPTRMTDLDAGDEVTFSQDMVRDWSLISPDGVMWGNYTTRVIVPQLDAEMAEVLSGMLSDDPVPADW